MTVTTSALVWGDRLFTGLALLVGVVALWMWAQAILSWGDAYAFAEALTWTVLTLVAFAPAIVIEYVRNGGD